MSQEGPIIPSVTMMGKVDIMVEADKAAADARARFLSNERSAHLEPENYPPNPLPPPAPMPDHPIPDNPGPDTPEKHTGTVVATTS